MVKLKEMVSSITFWQSVVGAVILILGERGIIPLNIAVVIAGWCGWGVVKRTADKVIDK